MVDLENRTAIVTGASSGVGAATGRALARHGADVILAARRIDRLEALAEEIQEDHHVTATARRTDVSDEVDATELVEETISRHGELDILVNNAGVSHGADVAELDTAEYRTMMGVNTDGCFFVTRDALPHLVENEGHLIFTGSFAGQYPRPFNPVYAATKWWVRGFALSVASQYGDRGVGVTVVNPSEVRTEFSTSDGVHFKDRFEPGQVTEPEEIAEAIVYAAGTEKSVPFEINLYRRDKLADTF